MKLIAVLIFGLACLGAFAGPFNVDMGDPLDGEDIEVAANGLPFEIRAAPLGFDVMAVFGTEKSGVCKITLIDTIDNADAYGSTVKSRVGGLKETLTAKYGAPSDEFDFLSVGSIWKEPREWMMALHLEERHYSFFWKPARSSESDIKAISLRAKASRSTKASIRLTYELDNFVSCLAEVKEQQDSQF